MRKTLKRQALEHILQSMENIENNLYYHTTEKAAISNSEAMKNLAVAYTLVKRGVMLPDAWEELEKRVRGDK